MKELINQPGKGVAFRRNIEAGSNQPNFKGGINIAGTEFELAMWERQSKAGKPYLSISVKEKAQTRIGEQEPF